MAWTLPPERMPVSRPAAPQLRTARLERWLGELGYEVRTPLAPPPTSGGAGRGTLRALLDATAWMAAAPRLALRARRERPVLVVASSALHGPALALLRRALGGRALIVVDAMGLRSLEVDRTTRLRLARAAYRPAWRALEALSFANADVVLTVNERYAGLIHARHGHGRVRVLRDTAEPELAELVPAPRGLLGVPDDALAVGFLGSVVCSRLDRILGAWEELAGDPGLRLVVVGDGPDLERHRREAAARGWLGHSVLMPGALPRDQALAALRSCDVAYTGSWSEAGFSSKLYEYLALGMPILVEDRPQMREALTDGESALFYSTPEELAGQIRRLASDPALRERLGAGARASFEESHTPALRRLQFAAALNGAAPATDPGVTVLMPVKEHHPRLLREAIASVQGQTSPEWRLLVIVEPEDLEPFERVLAEQLADPRVELVVNEGRKLSGAFNTGMRHARTEFVAILLGDDLWAPDAVETLVANIDSAPEVDFFHASRRYIDAAGRPLGEVLHSRPGVTLADFAQGAPVKHLLCWRRELALSFGGMDESLNCVGPDDFDFPWTMAEHGARFQAIPECLYHYRVHSESPRLTTHTPRSVHRRELARMLRKHGVGRVRTALKVSRASRLYMRQAIYRTRTERWLRERSR
jgi:glycosyltransferase involved in cell wall biosynthesis/GT2 family glycosyltransferase